MSNNSNESFKNVNLLEGFEIKGQKVRVGNQQISPPESPIQLYLVWVHNQLYHPPLNIIRRVGQY
jgi:hypothetical protein